MRDQYLLAAVALAGLLVCAAAFQLSQGDSYCERIADGIRQNQTFNGTVACYPPGEADVNVSDAIENRTALKCVCEKSYMGETSIFTINVADQAR
ncbi:MAG: hypothetical protein ABEJ98_04115 [Candidatus Nanohaloarchaea archaeon]